MSSAWVHKLNESDSRLHKEEILRQALLAAQLGNEISINFLTLLRTCYDPFVTFGVKQIPSTSGITNAENPIDRYKLLLQRLRTRYLSGNDARDAINEISQRFDSEEWNNFYAPVLRRDIRAGISEKTINKVCKGIDQYEVPVFSCQLATNCENRPEMQGQKRLEAKLDGCLSESWIVEFEDGSKVTIKEVVDKSLSGKIKSFNTISGKIEFNEILGWAKDGDDIEINNYEWFEIELENGKILPPLTGNHLVYLPKLKCYRRVDLLVEGDLLLEDA